jgi:beta-galactosidase
MATFEVKEDFLMNGSPFKLLSGAIHYFRIHPDDWKHSLYNLKALGFNTVETYVPWNLHEPHKGSFHFKGILDLERFLSLAQETGLYVILRPSPYICAEWEFGGLPAWLLEEPGRLRTFDQNYLAHVSEYYDVLLPKIAPHQLSQGGNILMIQVENEYGSYGEEKAYLKAIKEMLVNGGIDMPFFTSDGPWQATLRAGSLIEDNVLVTGNFGSRAKENFTAMQAFFDQYNKKWPLMCMEFWDGWFNRWNEPIIQRDPDELAESVKEALEMGSINLYMFHGGTNFEFMNGCSARGNIDLPQVTSYDYDAPLDEQGNPTAKYFALQKMLNEYFPEFEQQKPRFKSCFSMQLQLQEKVSLFSVIDQISEPITTVYPQTMEQLGCHYGYLLYRTRKQQDAEVEKLRIIDGNDRAQVFLNETLLATQYQGEIGEDLFIQSRMEENQLDILVENMGRVNYGHKLAANTQRKGIRGGVMTDLHFMCDWTHYWLDFSKSPTIDFTHDWHPKQPGFYRYSFVLEEKEDTFIDLTGFGKGIVLVNNVNIGRFWEAGPILSLFVSSGYLKQGENTIIIFETEGCFSTELHLRKKPVYKTMEGKV